jgi:hypothetical protein
MQKQMQLALAAEQATKDQVQLREKQFQLLMQCMLDLKASVNEESGNQDEEDDEEEDEGEEDEGLVSMDTAM